MMKMIFPIAILFTLQVLACDELGKTGIVEDNDLYIPVDSLLAEGLSEEQFNAVIDKVETIYAPIVKNMGGKLKINRKWTDGTVNASASRSGSTWVVNMFGGLARHATITEDGFALVLCHELGHHLGGAPKVANFFNVWASNEGQSDYYATLKCLRKVFLNDDNARVVSRLNAPKTLSSACENRHPDQADMNICIRSGMAGQSVSNLFAALRNKPEASFDTPDTSVVSITNDQHPAFQCRLDTYLQGAICDANPNEDVSQKDEVQGTCHKTLGHEMGLRPLCWFKPKVK